MTDPVVLAAVPALALLAWRNPIAGAAFVLSGATVYYALLGLLTIEPSATVSGLVFGATGLASTVGMLRERRRRSGYSARLLILFGAFFVLWQVRWWLSPPSNAMSVSSFGERAPLYMVVFAAVPFILGCAFGVASDRRKLLTWMALWGGAGVLILLGLMASGQQAWEGESLSRWRPIEGISTITMSVEIGLSALAFLSTTQDRAGIKWVALRVLGVCVPGLMLLRIGQRGPFLFFLASATVCFLGAPRARPLSRALQVAVVAGILGALIGGIVDWADTVRPLQGAKYTAEGNADRLAVWALAVQAIGERPLFGWGGDLVGQPVGASLWVYSHNIVLDPFVETGVIGGILVVAVLGAVIRGAWREWRRGRGADVFGVIPPFLFVMLEAQVSGHISTSKYVWLLAGVLAAVAARHAIRRYPYRLHTAEPSSVAEVA